MGDAALVTQLEAAAAAAAEAPRPQAQLLEELRDFLMHNGVYQSLLQLFADLDASGLTKVRLADFHRHLTQKLHQPRVIPTWRVSKNIHKEYQ